MNDWLSENTQILFAFIWVYLFMESSCFLYKIEWALSVLQILISCFNKLSAKFGINFTFHYQINAFLIFYVFEIVILLSSDFFFRFMLKGSWSFPQLPA